MKKEVRPNFLEFFFVRWHFPFKHLDMQKMSLFVCLSRTQRRCHFSKHQTWCQARFGFCVRARCLGAKFQLNILSTFILEVTCLGAFSRESNGARTHIDVKRQKRSGHWTSLVTSYGTSFDHLKNIWPYRIHRNFMDQNNALRESVANIRNQNRNKPELSVVDCILLLCVLIFSIFWKNQGLFPQRNRRLQTNCHSEIGENRWKSDSCYINTI